jgi:hypothetical protein
LDASGHVDVSAGRTPSVPVTPGKENRYLGCEVYSGRGYRRRVGGALFGAPNRGIESRFVVQPKQKLVPKKYI